MLYQIMDGTVSAGGIPILSHIDLTIKGKEKIGVVGRNGAGKTTLLRLIAGELELDRDDKRMGPGIVSDRPLTIQILHQDAVAPGDKEKTVEELLLAHCPVKDPFSPERSAYEVGYDRLFTGFGFAKADKKKPLSAFSGGEQKKIAFIRLLLIKPDILLLDEPTDHLDIATVEWLEQYMKSYEKAVVTVSHDRFFLDQVVDVVYALEAGKLERYPGSYTHYREQRRKDLALRRKAYERQQQELARLDGLVERFKHKPNKASFARAKRKMADRMERIEKPVEDDVHIFTGDITPLIPGSKWALEAEHLKVGYDKPLLELSLRVKRGQKIGIIGDNGAGKTAFLKTVAGLLPVLKGRCRLGERTTIGYFDQHSAAIRSEKRVKEHFHDLFPSLTEKEVRSVLGAYLFKGRDVSKRVSDLSGGERARLVLAELLQSRPNLLLLDEPTDHMDIQAKETLESALRAFKGTVLFVSHDRYFLRQVAEALLLFDGKGAMYYPFGYAHYLERRRSPGSDLAAQIRAEDQALIAGLKAAPRPERHRLREIGTEEAYLDWQLRLKGEQLEGARKKVEQLWDAWQEAGGAWCGPMPEELADAWEAWTESCILWDEAAAGRP